MKKQNWDVGELKAGALRLEVQKEKFSTESDAEIYGAPQPTLLRETEY